MVKSILIINQYAGNPHVGPVYRHHGMALALKSRGYSVTIIGANNCHTHSIPQKRHQVIDGVEYIWMRTLPYEGNGLGRKLSMALYGIGLFFFPYAYHKRNVVLVSSPSPFSNLFGVFISKLLGIPLIYEIRDVWPESFKYFTNLTKKSLVYKFVDWLDDCALRNCDLLLSPLPNIYKYQKLQRYKKDFMIIANGISYHNLGPRPGRKLRKVGDPLVIGYSGSYSQSNAVMTLLELAKLIEGGLDIEFRLFGKGELRKEMDDFIFLNSLSNVKLSKWLSGEDLLRELENCDIMYKGNPSSNLYKYGISSLKIPEYMSLAKPILMISDNDVSVKKANCGITVRPNSLESLVEELRYILHEDPAILDTWSINGWNYAKDNFVYENSIEPLINWFEINV